jgi:hypothetical protein
VRISASILSLVILLLAIPGSTIPAFTQSPAGSPAALKTPLPHGVLALLANGVSGRMNLRG